MRQRYTLKKKNLNKGLLGEGFHGKTYRLGAKKGETLAGLLENEKIEKIRLYTTDSEQSEFLTEAKDINKFISFLKNTRGIIAKIFKNVFYTTKQRDLEDELSINRKIISFYGKQARKYLTVAPVKFMHYNLLGAYIEIVGKETLYIAFGYECLNKYDVDGIKFLTDLLESLIILQKKNYQHNDIKLDNIVLCENRYKLIDWGQASPIEEFQFGDMIATNPMKWYLKGAPSLFSESLMDIRAGMTNIKYEKSELFKERNKIIISEFEDQLKKDPALLKRLYKRNMDVFMLGMTLLHAVHSYNLDYKKYKPIIDKFTSLIDPPKSAEDALEFLKRKKLNLHTVK